MNSHITTIPKLNFPEIYFKACKLLQQDNNFVWLVGGAIRTMILNQPVCDLDFLVSQNAILGAKQIANHLNGSFYILDKKRGVARVLLHNQNNMSIDVSTIHPEGLETDLKNRDFTVNAIAYNCKTNDLIDPTGGLQDLQKNTISMTSKKSFINDPIRLLRAIRLAVDSNFVIDQKTKKAMRQNIITVNQTSPERVRDELIKCIDGSDPSKAIVLLTHMNILEKFIPDLNQSTGIGNYEQSVKQYKCLQDLLGVIFNTGNRDRAVQYKLGYFFSTIFQDKSKLQKYLLTNTSDKRTLTQIMALAVLLKTTLSKIDTKYNNYLKFSNNEVHMLKAMSSTADITDSIDNHNNYEQLRNYTAKSIHRYHKKHKNLGICIALISLSEIMAYYGTDLPHSIWEHSLHSLHIIIDAYFNKYHQIVDPPQLLNGNDLISEFQDIPGTTIGKILNLITEEQVSGQINNKSDAMKYAKQIYESEK